MVYNITSIQNMENYCFIDESIWKAVRRNAETFSDEDAGTFEDGIILVVGYGTPAKELKQKFDYKRHIPEYVVENENHIISACYLANNEFCTVLVVHRDDAPQEILKALKEGC